MPTRILIADDHEVMRQGLRVLLKGRPGWEVCGEAVDGRDAVEKTKQLNPDITILDLTMPIMNGLDAARQILKNNSNVKILIFTMHESEELVRDVLKSGARGYVLKTDAARDLVEAVAALVRNETFFTSKVARLLERTTSPTRQPY